MWALGEVSRGGIEGGKEGRLGKRSRGSNSTESLRKHGNTEKVTAHLVRTVESEKGIHACQGRLRVYTTFYASFGLDYVEKFLEGTLEREELLDILILRD